MSDVVTGPLVLDLLEWLAPGPRPYGEAMEAWRTSCPRLTIWEDAHDAGLVVRRVEGPGRVTLVLTPAGERSLAAAGRSRRSRDGLFRSG